MIAPSVMATSTPTAPTMTTAQASAYLEMDVTTVTEWCRSGRLTAVYRQRQGQSGSSVWAIERTSVEDVHRQRMAGAVVPHGYLTTEQAAVRSRRNVALIQDWCRTGRLPSIRGPHFKRPQSWRYLIPADALDALIAPRPSPLPFSRRGDGPPTPEEKRIGYPIMDAVCAVLALPRPSLVKHAVGRLELAYVRRVVIYLLEHETRLSSISIARLLRRNHSTIHHHRAILANRPLTYEEQWLVDEVRALLAKQKKEAVSVPTQRSYPHSVYNSDRQRSVADVY